MATTKKRTVAREANQEDVAQTKTTPPPAPPASQALAVTMAETIEQECIFFLRGKLRRNPSGREALAKLVQAASVEALNQLTIRIRESGTQEANDLVNQAGQLLVAALMDAKGSGGGGDGVPESPLHP